MPVLASQLNRATEDEKCSPTLADFSLSDQIVPCANSVIALHRDKDGAGQRALEMCAVAASGSFRPSAVACRT